MRVLDPAQKEVKWKYRLRGSPAARWDTVVATVFGGGWLEVLLTLSEEDVEGGEDPGGPPGVGEVARRQQPG
eukprot:5212003-Lingulodinium_polyedra.AAC.1